MKRRLPRVPRVLVIPLILWVVALFALQSLGPLLQDRTSQMTAIVLAFIVIVFACVVFRLPGVGLALVVPLTPLILGVYALLRFGLLALFFASPAFQITTFVLAFVAIVFACIQFWDSRKHSRRMEEHGKSMEDIAKSISTQYIGVFPKDLEDILEVVTAAHSELRIMADTVAYGHYSEPETHSEFLKALDKARDKGVKVRFLVYDEELTMRALRRQFDPGKFDETRSSPQFDHYFGIYTGKDRPATHAELLSILRDEESDFTRKLVNRGASIRLLPKEESLFFWLEDDEDAVFSFENMGVGEALCFRTRDAKLVETFRNIFEQNWNSSQELKTKVFAKTA